MRMVSGQTAAALPRVCPASPFYLSVRPLTDPNPFKGALLMFFSWSFNLTRSSTLDAAMYFLAPRFDLVSILSTALDLQNGRREDYQGGNQGGWKEGATALSQAIVCLLLPEMLFSRSEDPPPNRFVLRVSISTAHLHWEAFSSSTSLWRCRTVTSRCWRRCWRAPTPRWTRPLRRGRVEPGEWDGCLDCQAHYPLLILLLNTPVRL